MTLKGWFKRPQAIPSDFNVDPDPMSGSYGADTLNAEATNAAGSILTNSNWTTVSTDMFRVATAGPWTLLSNGESRDQEVTTWVMYGRIFLRLTSSGRALMFEPVLTTANGTLTISIVDGVDDTNYNPTTTENIWSTSQLNVLWPAISLGGAGDKTDGETFTFGVSGFEIYVKHNGVELFRFKDYHHVVSGKVGLKNNTGYGFRETDVVFNESVAMESVLDASGAGTFDLRDFGFKTLGAVTGSIDVGVSATTLNMTDASGVEIGDYLLIPVGYEAGAGVRGTKGVGGTWPALSYANTAAREADAAQANNTFAWQEDTGETWRWVSGVWTQPYSTVYYLDLAVPRGLRARVTNVVGNAVTLDTAATVSCNNAPVRHDCSPAIAWLGQVYAGTSNDITAYRPATMDILMPSGTYYGAGQVYLPETGTVTLRGAHKTLTLLETPRGFCPMAITGFADGTTIKDFTLTHNVRTNGFGMGWSTPTRLNGWSSSGLPVLEAVSTGLTETSYTSGVSTFPPGVFMNAIANGVMRDLKIIDVFQKAVGTTFCADTWAYDIEVVQTEPIWHYVQWLIQWADSTGGGVDGFDIDCNYLTSCFEAFKCSGGTVIRNGTVRNGSGAANGSEGYTYENIVITIENNSQHDGGGGAYTPAFSYQNPIININNNIGVAAGAIDGGGTLRNIQITQEGVINASNDMLSGIVTNLLPNILIDTFTFTAPDYVSGNTGFRPIDVGGANTDLVDVTINGRSKFVVTGSGYKAINHAANSTIASGSSHTNVVTSPVANDVTGPS